jgi:hypothetical protein
VHTLRGSSHRVDAGGEDLHWWFTASAIVNPQRIVIRSSFIDVLISATSAMTPDPVGSSCR